MRIRLQGTGHAAGLLSELNRCRLSRLYCDVFLQVGARSFSGHRAVLACAGAHFRSMFARAQQTQTSAYSLDFVSPGNFEKVLTFIYTGEILIDLIDVGVLYELADRLGVSELVRACHATFPDLRGSLSTDCKANNGPPGDLGGLDSDMAAGAGATGVSASSACSSAASCSSLSSSAGPSATPTPAAAPSPLLLHHARTPRLHRDAPSHHHHHATMPLSLELKAEDIQSHLGYGQITTDEQLAAEHGLLADARLAQTDRVPPPAVLLQLKTEEVEGEKEPAGGGGASCGGDNNGDGRMAAACEDTSGALPRSGHPPPPPSDPCSFPDPSAQAGGEASGDPLGSLRVGAVEGGVVEVSGDGRLVFEGEEGGEGEREGGELALQGDGGMEVTEVTEEEQWRQLAGEIIELSDDENYMEEEEEEDDEDDLVCVENGGSAGGQTSSLSCKACGVSFPADPVAVRTHAETHLTETGLCRVCGASYPDRAAAIPHAVAHTGVTLFTCDLCRLQFCSQNKLLRHRRQTSSCYTLPPGLLSAAHGPEAQCAVCTKTFTKDIQAVRDHLLTHVCTQSLSCGVCHLPQLSLCSLLWHALTHLSLPVYSCPHCAQSFLERPLLDRHMATHGEEAVALERVRSGLASSRGGGGGGLDGGGGSIGVGGGMEELRCFLCPQTFRSTSAFQYHLSLHSAESLSGGGGMGGGGGGWSGKRKLDQAFDYTPCSSSGQREAAGSLVKLSNLGFGLGFNMSEKFPPSGGGGMGGGGFSSGFLANGGSPGLDRSAAEAAGVRGKWYRCRYCGKRFAHSGEFTYHLRIHTGEKPYQCKVCLRFFRGRSTMICHLKTHAGALMYRCTVCGLYFSTLKLVSSHMEVHKDHLPPDFNIEQTFMYNDHSKEPLPVSMDP